MQNVLYNTEFLQLSLSLLNTHIKYFTVEGRKCDLSDYDSSAMSVFKNQVCLFPLGIQN